MIDFCDKRRTAQKETLDFDKGCIPMMKRTVDFINNSCHYYRLWGWCLPSTREVPKGPQEYKGIHLALGANG